MHGARGAWTCQPRHFLGRSGRWRSTIIGARGRRVAEKHRQHLDLRYATRLRKDPAPVVLNRLVCYVELSGRLLDAFTKRSRDQDLRLSARERELAGDLHRHRSGAPDSPIEGRDFHTGYWPLTLAAGSHGTRAISNCRASAWGPWSRGGPASRPSAPSTGVSAGVHRQARISEVSQPARGQRAREIDQHL
jgi:hypothetical protein